jgi:hypothetical protein
VDVHVTIDSQKQSTSQYITPIDIPISLMLEAPKNPKSK